VALGETNFALIGAGGSWGGVSRKERGAEVQAQAKVTILAVWFSEEDLVPNCYL